MKIKDVVGIAFIKDNRLLVVQSKKSSKTNSYTFIGGSVEEGETILEAAVREVGEEIHSGFTISKEDLELALEKEEQAASDPSKRIKMHIFIAHKEIDVPLIPNEEILIYNWYKIGDNINVSNSIKDFLEYAKKHNLMK